MIPKLIAFLQWIESSEKPKKWFDFFFSFGFTIVSITILNEILTNTIFRRDYYSYDRDFTNVFSFNQDILSNTWLLLLSILFLGAILITYLYGIYKKATRKDFSIVRIIMNGVVPLSVGLINITMAGDPDDFTPWYIYLFGGLYAFSPFVLFFSCFKRVNTGFIKKIFDLYKKYIVSFLIGLSIFILLWISGK